MRFASRCDFGLGESAYGEALRKARQRGGLLDLTVSNPTRCGFLLPPTLLQALADPRGQHYAPDPQGLPSARQAVADLYLQRYGVALSPDRVLLTASTSESYSYLLRLVCEPGDAILVPSPSYPLFNLLAQLHDVRIETYPLVYHDGWQIDPVSLERACTDRTRAIFAVHPNNPTGHYYGPAERHLLQRCALEWDVPLIVDEVFFDYQVEEGPHTTFADAPENGPVTVVLGGLSKALCAPQMKLAWSLLGGPPKQVAQAMERLQVIADTFLSVATSTQLALPVWCSAISSIQSRVVRRIRDNLAWLDGALHSTAVSRLRVEGGWCAILRVPAREPDVSEAIRLLGADVAVHPGSFYGMPERGWLVVSLLVPAEIFAKGIQMLLTELAG